MRYHRIAIIGSRKLDGWKCGQLSDLACELAKRGHMIVSGGCKQGADEAAHQGVRRYNNGDSLTLYLDRKFHQYSGYAHASHLVWVNPSEQTPEWELAKACALPGQWESKYRGLFVRNGYVAYHTDLEVAWIQDDSRGTQHTINCAVYLGHPVLLCHQAWDAQPWQSSEEFVTRVLRKIEAMEQEQ